MLPLRTLLYLKLARKASALLSMQFLLVLVEILSKNGLLLESGRFQRIGILKKLKTRNFLVEANLFFSLCLVKEVEQQAVEILGPYGKRSSTR